MNPQTDSEIKQRIQEIGERWSDPWLELTIFESKEIANKAKFLVRQSITHALTELATPLLERMEMLEKENDNEKKNQPFYKELCGDFEKALGPHPRYENGCWIQRIEELRQQLMALEAQNKQYKEALEQMVERYTSLINSGDCGNWNPEEEKEVIAARMALMALSSTPQPQTK